jgi:hypothetical protein
MERKQMKRFSNLFIALSLTLISTIFISAQEAGAPSNNRAANNQISGNQVSDAAGGYSFIAPSGWTKKAGDGGHAIVNAAETVVIAVKAHNYKNFQAFAENANLAADGLELVGKIEDFGTTGKWFLAAKRTNEGTLVVATFVLFSPHSGGVALAAFSNYADSKAALLMTHSVAETVRFTKPNGATAQIGNRQESTGGNEWQNYLRGKHLIYLNTSGSFSDRTDIYLCASGAFYYKGNTSGLSTGGSGDLSMSSADRNNGTWRATGGQLILQFETGGTREYALARRQAAGEISLNGRRYFVKSDADCQ